MTPEQQEIREAFALEAVEMLAEMEGALLDLEAHPQSAGDGFNRLFRTVHTIKGSAGIVSADYLEQFCHSLESLLVRIRERELSLSHDLIGLFLQCHDHITRLTSDFEAGDDAVPPRQSPLIAALESYVASSAAVSAEALYEDEAGQGPVQDVGAALAATSSRKVVRVDAQKLDQLINLVVELGIAGSELESHVKRLGDSASIESVDRVSLLVKKIQERAMVFRMVPVGDLFRRFNRVAHDLADICGKQIQLVTSGQETELDKVMAERLHEPLLHLIRNAADHGIESAAERHAVGKPLHGTISMNAYQEAGYIIIEVRDDGRGISRERVQAKAIASGLLKGHELGDRDPLTLIFEPGFSTMDEATMLSGRGVGMDVVLQTVESLRGSIHTNSVEGKGTSFLLKMPLSLALIDGFMVSIAGDNYILPMELVDETIDLPAEQCQQLAQRSYLAVRGEALPYIDPLRIVKPDASVPVARFAVIVRYEGRRIGVLVDRLVGELKAVIKPLGKLYSDVRVISGATILGDGSIALILDLPELIRLSQDVR